MAYAATCQILGRRIRESFDRFDAWLDHPIVVGRDRHAAGGWSADQVVDHVTRTSQFLLLTLTKQVALAERRALRGAVAPLPVDAET